jgi:four helix bundle protein
MQDFRDLRVWALAHEVTLAAYRITSPFPREELFGLSSQIRRAAASIPANLAEGCGRNGNAEFARFCSIAMGSASELDYHLLLARDLKLIKSEDYDHLAPQVSDLKRMLTGLRKKLTTENG